MPAYKAKTYNTVALLQNEEQGQLEKIFREFDSSNRSVQEYKTFPDAKPKEVALSRTFNYDINGDLIGERVDVVEWTQLFEDNTVVPITDVLIDKVTVDIGVAIGTVIGTLSTVGGVPPYTYTIPVNPGNIFKIQDDDDLAMAVVSTEGSFPITVQVRDSQGQLFNKNFTIVVDTFVDINSITFDGVNEYIDVGNPTDMEFDRTDTFSFSMWIKPTTSTGTRVFISNTNSSARGFLIAVDGASNDIRFIFRRNATIFIDLTAGTIAQDVWSHVVITYDGSSLAAGFKTYIDSVLQNNVVATDNLTNSPVSTDNVFIGAQNSSGAPILAYLGLLNEMSVYNIELTSQNAVDLYNLGKPDDQQNNTGIIHWWRMGEGATFPTIPDEIGTATGTMTNMEAGDIGTDVP